MVKFQCGPFDALFRTVILRYALENGTGGGMILSAERVFDGERFHDHAEVLIHGGHVAAVRPAEGPVARGTLAPGFLDLQVNGGNGVMTGPDTLNTICEAHARLGATGILPTLITDTPDRTAAVIAAGRACTHPGFLGLHLEGPHLDPARKGAHEPALIRPMTDDDLARLCQAARDLPALMVTLAPEAATPDQIARLAAAGVVVSLGHSDCPAEVALAAIRAGAACVTHVFNAMSQIAPRNPGLAGVALSGRVPAGIIADGVHVDPMVLRLALGHPHLFLVSDAMAVAGTAQDAFHLNGRRILRRDGRLTLPDGTLAGADLALPRAIRTMIDAGADEARALSMATRIPAGVIGSSRGRIAMGAQADLVHLDREGALRQVWRAGKPVLG